MNKCKKLSILLSALILATCTTACGSQEHTEDNVGLNEGGNGADVDGFLGAIGDGIVKGDSAAGSGDFKNPDVLEEGVVVDDAVLDLPALDDVDNDTPGESSVATPVNTDIPVEDETATDITTEEITESVTEEVKHDNKVGMLTAAMWNDHSNWGFFSNLVNTGTVSLPEWCPNIANRIKVTVTNPAGEALPNEKITLIGSDGSNLYNAVTDKDGIAYLFEFQSSIASKVVASDGTEAILEQLSIDTQSSGSNSSNREVELVVGVEKTQYSNMQIQFIIDTTGSMGDEMLYLQSDFKSIAEEVGIDNKEFSTVFYKDNGDEYVTKFNQFTSNVNDITSQLSNESADGGGDLPEAVSEALNCAFSDVEWHDDAVKLAFLIFDAPPHADRASLDKVADAIANAADKGIRIIPVVSSNSERDTEIFGRAIAIATGGDYVFLTDDSGIGESHLEPIIGEYEVRTLHEIITDIINKYDQAQ